MSCAPIEQLAAQAFAAHGTMVAPVADALDDVSFLFYVRTLRLRVGDVDTIRAISSRGAR
ncbi:MAG: hypothetical protein ABIT91_15980 [Gemmatimonadaceae bacterium]